MEHRSESRYGVSSGSFYLAHHVHGDGSALSQCETHLAAAVSCAQLHAQPLVGLCDGKSAHLYGPKAFDVDVAVG